MVRAGPTGLTLAAELARHSAVPRIVDRSADRVHESRAGDGTLVVEPAELRHLGWRAGLLLVRPDWHICYSSGMSGMRGLVRYLERWLIATGELHGLAEADGAGS